MGLTHLSFDPLVCMLMGSPSVQKRAMVEKPNADSLKDPFATPAPARKPQPVQQQTADEALKPSATKAAQPLSGVKDKNKIPQNPKKQKKLAGRGKGGRGKSAKSGKSGKK